MVPTSCGPARPALFWGDECGFPGVSVGAGLPAADGVMLWGGGRVSGSAAEGPPHFASSWLCDLELLLHTSSLGFPLKNTTAAPGKASGSREGGQCERDQKVTRSAPESWETWVPPSHSFWGASTSPCRMGLPPPCTAQGEESQPL